MSSLFLRALLVVPTAVTMMAFIPMNSPIDVNMHSQPREGMLPKQNLVPIACAKLNQLQAEAAQFSDQRQHLLQQLTAAIQQNDSNLIATIQPELMIIQRKEGENLAVMRALSSIPVHVDFSLRPSSDRALFLLGQSDPSEAFEGHEYEHPRWNAGTITYLSYTSDLPTYVEFRSGYSKSFEYTLDGDKPIITRKPNILNFNAPLSDGTPYPSIDPFSFRTCCATQEVHEDAYAPIKLVPDTAVNDCEARNCIYSLRFGEGTFDLTTDQICKASNSPRGAIFSLVVDYNIAPFDLRVTYLVGFDATKKVPTTSLQIEALNEAIDGLLKEFISDVVGPAQLYLVNNNAIRGVSPGIEPWDIDTVRQQLSAFHDSIVSGLGHQTAIAEVDEYFGASNLTRYREIGDGKIEFVFRVGDKEATLDFARYPNGVRLFKVSPLGPAKP